MLPMGVIVMGVSGAGKSTLGEALARRHGRLFIEGDLRHPETNIAKMAAGVSLTDEDRWPWLERVADDLGAAARRGGGIASCSALRRRYRDFLRCRLPRNVAFIHPVMDRETLRIRVEARGGHYMPASLLTSQFATLETPAEEEGVIEVSAHLSLDDQLDFIDAIFVR